MSRSTRLTARGDAVLFIALFLCGVVFSILTPSGELRPWFALIAFLCAVTFVVRYAFRRWSSTPAGIAVMVSMAVTTVYTGHATLMFWYPDVIYGYPHWETVMEIIYLLIAIAALYKTKALTRENPGEGRRRFRKRSVPSDPRGVDTGL